jgi:penicillin-binding protein 2
MRRARAGLLRSARRSDSNNPARAGMSRLGTSARDRRAGSHQGRFLAVVLLVAVGFAALVGRLGQVQLVGHDDFRAAASALDTRTLVVPALRGRILDREGQVLADNRASTVVTIERRVIADRDDRGASVVRDVASVLGLDPADLLGRT